MKAKQFLLSVVLVAAAALFTNLYASTTEVFNDSYKVSSEATTVVGKDIAKTWSIVYGDSKRPVTVLLKQSKYGDEYIVRTNYFEVKYVNGAKGFGVKAVNASEQTVPLELNYKVLSSESLNRQKVISGTKLEDGQVIDMIASFLPELINGQFKNILN